MKNIRKPSWLELYSNELLQVYNGKLGLSHERWSNLLEYLMENGCRVVEAREELLQKLYLTQEEYESIEMSYTLLDSRGTGENEGMSKEMKERIRTGREKSRNPNQSRLL